MIEKVDERRDTKISKDSYLTVKKASDKSEDLSANDNASNVSPEVEIRRIGTVTSNDDAGSMASIPQGFKQKSDENLDGSPDRITEPPIIKEDGIKKATTQRKQLNTITEEPSQVDESGSLFVPVTPTSQRRQTQAGPTPSPGLTAASSATDLIQEEGE